MCSHDALYIPDNFHSSWNICIAICINLLLWSTLSINVIRLIKVPLQHLTKQNLLKQFHLVTVRPDPNHPYQYNVSLKLTMYSWWKEGGMYSGCFSELEVTWGEQIRHVLWWPKWLVVEDSWQFWLLMLSGRYWLMAISVPRTILCYSI